MTSALCSTNGRISSPAPNRSPTSFIAGQQHFVQHADRRQRPLRLLRAALGERRQPLGDRLVEQRLDAFLLAMQDASVDPLVDG